MTAEDRLFQRFCDTLISLFPELQGTVPDWCSCPCPPQDSLAGLAAQARAHPRLRRVLRYLRAVAALDLPVVPTLIAKALETTFSAPLRHAEDTPSSDFLARYRYRAGPNVCLRTGSPTPSARSPLEAPPKGRRPEQRWFCHELARRFPTVRLILETTLRDYPAAGSTHVLYLVARHLVRHPCDDRQDLVDHLELHLLTGDPYVRAMIAIGFISGIGTQDELRRLVAPGQAPRLSSVWYLTWSESSPATLPPFVWRVLEPIAPPVELYPEAATAQLFCLGLPLVFPELEPLLQSEIERSYGDLFPYSWLHSLARYFISEARPEPALIEYLDYQLMLGSDSIRTLIALSFVLEVDQELEFERLLCALSAPTLWAQWERIYRPTNSSPEGT